MPAFFQMLCGMSNREGGGGKGKLSGIEFR